MKSEIPKEIVFAWFSGNATVLQKRIINEWIKDPNNVEIYFEWLQEWESANNHFATNSKKAFHNFELQILKESAHSHVTETETSTKKTFSLKRYFPWKIIVAASVFIICSLIFVLQYSEKEYHTGFRQTEAILLPDGSTVLLNANSKLSHQRFGFGYFSRNVHLSGEAEFKIKHTIDNQKFIVLTPDDSKVTVLGTEFTVYTRSNETSVVLNKGVVMLSNAVSPVPKTMKPGEQATITNAGPIQLKTVETAKLESQTKWQEHSMEFNQTPLSVVVNQLRKTFGVEIFLANDNLKNRQLTGSFKAKDPDELLEVLSEMMNIKINVNDGKITLEEKQAPITNQIP